MFAEAAFPEIAVRVGWFLLAPVDGF